MTTSAKPFSTTAKIAAIAATAMTAGALSAQTASQANAASNVVELTETGGQRCITSNGIPDHTTGTFPNSGNPNSIKTQSQKLCVTSTPTKGSTAKTLRGTTGFALNGIILRPGTADWYDGSTSRGHSRDRSSGWNLEGMGSRVQLGLDQNNAHVDNRGVYHYHGPSSSILNAAKGTLIGYSADGHEIHYMGSNIKSSWQLKSGTRPSAPGGAYDGSYNQDWQYVASSGNLDECNGGQMNGKYVYFATDTYPFFPRCAYGDISSDFAGPQGNNQQDAERQGDNTTSGQQTGKQAGKPRRQGQKGNKGRQNNQQAETRRGNRQQGNRRGPPAFALAACETKSVGNSCSMTTNRGNLTGQCVMTPDQQKACRPNRS